MKKTSAYQQFCLILLLAVLFLIPSTASHAYQNDIPTLIPVNGWSVGQSGVVGTRGLQNANLPCVMSAEYNNGFIIRLSGSRSHIDSISIDFRQNSFRTGKNYDTFISIDGIFAQRATANAVSNSVLVIDARNMTGLYQSMAHGSLMVIHLGNNEIKLSLDGASNALARLDACYGLSSSRYASSSSPVPYNNLAAANTAPTAPYPYNGTMGARQPDIISTPVSYDNEVPQPLRVDGASLGKAEPIYAMQNMSRDTALPNRWIAYKGESFRNVLQRWSSQNNTKLVWKADFGDTILNRGINTTGSFDDAVRQLLKLNGLSGINGKIEKAGRQYSLFPNGNYYNSTGAGSDNWPVGITARKMPAAMNNNNTQPAVSPPPPPVPVTYKWKAPKGSSLRAVLETWAQMENVSLIWHSDRDYPLKRDAAYNGSFEKAVENLLQQFVLENNRPFGRYNIPEDGGTRMLLITNISREEQ